MHNAKFRNSTDFENYFQENGVETMSRSAVEEELLARHSKGVLGLRLLRRRRHDVRGAGLRRFTTWLMKVRMPVPPVEVSSHWPLENTMRLR